MVLQLWLDTQHLAKHLEWLTSYRSTVTQCWWRSAQHSRQPACYFCASPVCTKQLIELKISIVRLQTKEVVVRPIRTTYDANIAIHSEQCNAASFSDKG